MPRDQPVFCFEVEIINRGDDGYIGRLPSPVPSVAGPALALIPVIRATEGIGLARRGLPVQSLPGWKAGSYGYHGDDGKIFGGSGEGTDFGPTFTTGDTPRLSSPFRTFSASICTPLSPPTILPTPALLSAPVPQFFPSRPPTTQDTLYTPFHTIPIKIGSPATSPRR